MTFSIFRLLFFVTYAAVALASLQFPNQYLLILIGFICFLSVAIAAVIAFDRKSTPYFSYCAFALLGAASEIPMPSYLTFWLMGAMKIPTGSVEYNALSSMLHYHIILIFALIGYVFGTIVASYHPSKAKPSDASESH